MTDKVWIKHPNLPDGQEVEVRADAVRHYSMSGWVPLDEPPEWATVYPEQEALKRLQEIARNASGMPDAPDGRPARDPGELQRLAQMASGLPATSDSGTDTESAPDNGDSGDESADQTDGTDEPTGAKRVRRASSAPKGDK